MVQYEQYYERQYSVRSIRINYKVIDWSRRRKQTRRNRQCTRIGPPRDDPVTCEFIKIFILSNKPDRVDP